MFLKFCSIINSLWKSSDFVSKYTKSDVSEIIMSLVDSNYRFSPMFRSFIPKPKKPGQWRPITQPAERDRLVMKALSHLLNPTLDSSFSEHSHGFRPRRGSISFMRAVREWPALDMVIKCDIEKCFDRIDHNLLLSFLDAKFEKWIVELIASFLKTPIYDKEGKNYAFQHQGIPQGSPISPVLMNFFMHHFDIELSKWMYGEDGTSFFFYERYADDMVFGIPKGDGARILIFKKRFFQALRDLRLSSTFVMIVRDKKGGQRRIEVLGLLFFLKHDGRLHIRTPQERWQKRLHLPSLLARLQASNLPINLENLLLVLLKQIRVYLFYAFLALGPSRSEKKRLSRFFQHLLQERAMEFVNKHQGNTNSILNLYELRVNQIIEEVWHKMEAKERRECKG